VHNFYGPANVVWPAEEAEYICPVHLSMHLSVCVSQNVNVISQQILTKLTETMHYSTEMNASHFGARSKGQC